MAIKNEFEEVTDFSDWYDGYNVDPNDDSLVPWGRSKCAARYLSMFDNFKMEMDTRVGQYEKYEKQAAAEFVSAKPDLPNVSSGESAGFIRRIARNTVQHTPNVFINNEFDDDSVAGHLARYLLKTKIIGDDEYSNDMQQHLITTARRGFTIGFDCVIPVLQQNALGQWYMLYDTIHYRDVFPEPGAKDVRRANDVFIRRYITKGDVARMIKNQPHGWDVHALRSLLKTSPQSREVVDHEGKKHKVNSEAYEVITWYSNSGAAFLTWSRQTGHLLRIEKNKHPLKEHPVMFFVPEKDDQQPFGKSLLSLTFGRQEFQDLFLNGAMKMWWRNVNPPIIGFGTVNAMPNLSPGGYTQISNPNAKVEAFEINTQALMMFGQISQTNAANMVQMMGAADQQMAMQGSGGIMSQTPQGVEAQQQMVDITTNNYQKAMEVFFSRYCSYALTLYFQEMKGTPLTPSADARKQMIDGGLAPEAFIHEAHEVENEEGVVVTVPADNTGLKDGELEYQWKDLATLYYVQCVPGSLVELEDEKERRALNEMFIPLSQSMPALAQTGDQKVLSQAANAMMFIVRKQLEYSTSSHSRELDLILKGEEPEQRGLSDRIAAVEDYMSGNSEEKTDESELQTSVLLQMRAQMSMQNQIIMAMASALGLPTGAADGAGDGAERPALPVSEPNAAPGAPTDATAAAGPEVATEAPSRAR